LTLRIGRDAGTQNIQIELFVREKLKEDKVSEKWQMFKQIPRRTIQAGMPIPHMLQMLESSNMDLYVKAFQENFEGPGFTERVAMTLFLKVTTLPL
jgi:hypothetical protein